MGLVLNYEEAKLCEVKIIGNKAYNLLKLYPQYLIPRGVVVPINVTRGIIDGRILAKDVVRKIIESLDFNVFAVRSSTCVEDSKDYSFAGQFVTHCGVPVADLENACIKVIESAKRKNMKPYRDIAGATSTDIGVLVQEMLPCRVAGIMFTKNPINQRNDQVIIEAAFGLGEYIVSGRVIPDHIECIKKNKKYKYSLGNQTSGLFLEDRKLVDKAVINEVPILNPEEVMELVGIGIDIEKDFKFPQDIEWGIVDNKVYILQSRPITT